VYPLGQWVQAEVSFRHGKGRPATWTLRLRTANRDLVTKDGLPWRSAEFARCTWFGVVGADTAKAAFYVDDVVIEPGE
jgi:hypothetical protein